MIKNKLLELSEEELKKVKQRYIVFEGILCCGKTTQLFKTGEYLKTLGCKIACFEEAGELIRPVFRQLKFRDDWVDGHLFAADTLYQNELIKRQDLDTIILEERSFLSTFVYQKNLGKGIILNWHNMNNYFDDLTERIVSETFRMPEAAIILDVEIEEAFTRAKKSSHKIEKWDTPENLFQARKRYKDLVAHNSFTFPICFIEMADIETTWTKKVKPIIDSLLNTPLKPVKFFQSSGKLIY